jgi:hypothetical protein
MYTNFDNRDNSLLGKLTVKCPYHIAKQNKSDLVFELDNDGILHVTATTADGLKTAITIENFQVRS